jgi:hypothetical protein
MPEIIRQKQPRRKRVSLQSRYPESLLYSRQSRVQKTATTQKMNFADTCIWRMFVAVVV